jgi:hypothetical protein
MTKAKKKSIHSKAKAASKSAIKSAKKSSKKSSKTADLGPSQSGSSSPPGSPSLLLNYSDAGGSQPRNTDFDDEPFSDGEGVLSPDHVAAAEGSPKSEDRPLAMPPTPAGVCLRLQYLLLEVGINNILTHCA